MKTFNLFILLLFLTACHSNKKVIQDNTLKRIAIENFGNNMEIIYNEARTHALVFSKNEPSARVPANALEFGIYDMDKKRLTYREQKYNATVAWFDDSHLIIR